MFYCNIIIQVGDWGSPILKYSITNDKRNNRIYLGYVCKKYDFKSGKITM